MARLCAILSEQVSVCKLWLSSSALCAWSGTAAGLAHAELGAEHECHRVSARTKYMLRHLGLALFERTAQDGAPKF